MRAVGECWQSSVWKRPRAAFDYPSSPLENRCSSVQNWTGQGGWVSRRALVWPRWTAETPTVSFARGFLYKLAHFTFSSLGNTGFLCTKGRFSLLPSHVTLLSSWLQCFSRLHGNNADNFQIWDCGDSYSTSERSLSEYLEKPRSPGFVKRMRLTQASLPNRSLNRSDWTHRRPEKRKQGAEDAISYYT